MAPFEPKANCGPIDEAFTCTRTRKINLSSAGKLSMSSGYNDVGGRPDERLGLCGSFTPGVPIIAGGPSRDVPLEPEIDHGTVLFTYPELKPDMSHEARTNPVRPTERLGSTSSFTPGAKRWLGGLPRNVSLEKEIDHAAVLFTYPELKPDMSCEAHTNAVRPTERWGSKGSFTPGAKRWLGGLPRNVSLEKKIDPGTILFTYPDLKPDMSREARTNATRPDERLGTTGSFTRPDIRRFLGGEPRDIPLEAEIDHGTILFTYPDLKPNMSGEARTNPVRPDERLGTNGSFAPGRHLHWRGGEPREVARERELMHGTVLFPVPFNAAAATAAGGEGREEDDGGDFFFSSDGMEVEEEVSGGPMQVNGVPGEDTAMFNGAPQGVAADGGGNDVVFTRCGSDSKFPAAGADLMSGNFPAF